MNKRYIRSFDGLRTLGVISVILYHMFPNFLKGGYLGVVLSFVVSGYLITDLTLQDYDVNSNINIGNFYLRRLKRLYPAMIPVMMVTALYSALFHPAFLNNMKMVFVSSIFSFNNWWQIGKGSSYFSRLMAEAPFTHFYSLAIEAQFYLIWPVALLTLLKIVKHKGKIFLVLLMISLISALEMAILFQSNQDPTRVYYGTDTRLFSILMGASLAFIWPSHKLHRLNPNAKGRQFFNKIFYSSLAVGFILILFLPDQSWFTYRGGMLLFSLVSMILVGLVAHPNMPYQSYFSNKVFDYIGSRSYGIYLWQTPILTFTELRLGKSWLSYSIATCIILALSELSFRFIETPLRKITFSEGKESIRTLFQSKTWSSKRIFLGIGLTISILALGIIFLSPSKDNEQSKIAQEIASKQEAIKSSNQEKQQSKKTQDKISEVNNVSDTSQFDQLSAIYSVSNEQLAEAMIPLYLLLVILFSLNPIIILLMFSHKWLLMQNLD